MKHTRLLRARFSFACLRCRAWPVLDSRERPTLSCEDQDALSANKKAARSSRRLLLERVSLAILAVAVDVSTVLTDALLVMMRVAAVTPQIAPFAVDVALIRTGVAPVAIAVRTIMV